MDDKSILIGLGANLPGPAGGTPRETLEAALSDLERRGVRVKRRSRWYSSAPVPESDQPWFVNGVAVVEFDGAPGDLLRILWQVENAFGRVRRTRDEARVIDLDILACGETVETWGAGSRVEGTLELPHPELQNRAFVLLPMAEVVSGWRHPVSGRTLEDLIAGLPPGQSAEPLTESAP